MKNKIAVLYGPQGGNTERVANLIAKTIGETGCDLIPVNKVDAKIISDYSSFIIGSSTIGRHNWSVPNSSSDWDNFLPEFKKLNFAGKKVAIFNLGDHLGYPNSFVDGMRVIYDILIGSNATVLGSCSTDDYEFNESQAVVDGKFVGLPVDEDYQEEFTEERVEHWLKSFIKDM